ncbi:MAG TPA: glycosyltransferase [Acidimicrobiales bacterium]
MTARIWRFGLVALVPTAVDIGLLVLLRLELGWILVLADLMAIAIASLLSYGLHRTVTFRSDPYVRWVRMPGTFLVVAVIAALVDVVVLRSLFAAEGFTTAASLVLAKVVALLAAAGVRFVLYRAVLLGAVRRGLQARTARTPAGGSVRASIVVPALDEAEGIASAIAEIRTALADLEADGGVEVVVVDDGSTDGTADAALAAGADQVVVLPVNRGKGAAVRAGVAAARGRTVAFTDADLAYSPDQLLLVIGEVEAGWDVAVGNRRHPSSSKVRGAGSLRDVGSKAINLLASGVLLSHPHDTQCGLKAFRADVAKAIFSLSRVDRFAFDIEILHLVERHELTLADVPVRLASSDRSTVKVVRDGLRLVRDIWRIRHWSATGAYELAEGGPTRAGIPGLT